MRKDTLVRLSLFRQQTSKHYNEIAKCSFSSVHHELMGTAANNSKDTPTTRERQSESGGREKRGTAFTQTGKQKQTQHADIQLIPYVIGENSAVSCPGNPKKVVHTTIAQPSNATQQTTHAASHRTRTDRSLVV